MSSPKKHTLNAVPAEASAAFIVIHFVVALLNSPGF